jgi:hypothetical protein
MNLTPAERLVAAEKLREKIAEEARLKKEEADKKFYGNRFTDDLESSPYGEQSKNTNESKVHTDKEIAKIAGVGYNTYRMGAKILNSDNEKVKQDVLSGKTKISAGYKDIINPNPIKLGRCFDFLREYYGIQHGGDRKSEIAKSKLNNSELISNEGLANIYNVSVDTMENYIKLSKAIPEVATLVETGIGEM